MGHPSASAIGLLNAAVCKVKSSYLRFVQLLRPCFHFSIDISGLVTAPFARYVSDHYGRRYCIVYTAITNLIGTVLGCVAGEGRSNGYGLFIASRIICGSGIAFALMVSPILLQELPHPR